MTAKPIAVMSIASVLLTACGAPTPQAAFNSRSDYAAEGLDLFQVIIVLGVVRYDAWQPTRKQSKTYLLLHPTR